MTVVQNEILLLKAQNDETEDKYEIILNGNGYTVKYLQVLEFEFCNLSTLENKLKNPDNYSGVIFTSPRSITAVKKCLNGDKINEKWNDKTNFVVGEMTYKLALELNFICEGKDSGNANNLVDIILRGNYDKPMLFPCGNLKKDTLQTRLQNHVELDTTTVYQTIKNSNLEKTFSELTNDFQYIPQYAVFFSPSGVKFTSDIFRRLTNYNIKYVAIGPSTEAELKKENFPVYSVAVKPTENDLLIALKK